jgi:ketosteroid isomerase-like protein
MFMMFILMISLWAAFGPAGCAPSGNLDEVREALLQVDRDFAAETERRGADGWADFFHADGVMFPTSGRVDGGDAIRERMQAVFTTDGPSLTWSPTDAVVGTGGDLGYTLGRWRSTITLGDGRDSTVARGHYVTIWKKLKGGAWKVAVDIGNTDAP